MFNQFEKYVHVCTLFLTLRCHTKQTILWCEGSIFLASSILCNLHPKYTFSSKSNLKIKLGKGYILVDFIHNLSNRLKKVEIGRETAKIWKDNFSMFYQACPKTFGHECIFNILKKLTKKTILVALACTKLIYFEKYWLNYQKKYIRCAISFLNEIIIMILKAEDSNSKNLKSEGKRSIETFKYIQIQLIR